MTTLSIPRGVAALTSDWLTHALDGTLAPGSRVASLAATRIGEGVGFLGELARVALTYDGEPGPAAPASVVVKLPTQDAAPRGLAQTFNLYEREVGFYRDIGTSVGVRVPDCYHVVSSPEDGDFALVLEDVQASPGDQLASCTGEQARAALKALATLHARWWESPRLSRLPWLPTKGDPFFDLTFGVYQQVLPVFLEHWSHRFDPYVVRACQRLPDCYHELIARWYERPLTLAHQDFRLDNMLFGEPGSPDEVVLIDWQLCQHALGALDLQYFISGNFPAEVGATNAEDWLRYYHEQLGAGGVRDYSLAALKDDYASASAVFALMIPLGITAIDPNNYDGRGRQLIEQLYGGMEHSMLRYEAERFLPA
jgi:hypothetical protein